MKYLKEFNNVMATQNEIALATANDNNPNVRIVNFYYDPNNTGVLYFSTFKGNRKIKEFTENNKVSFTTIPSTQNQHVRVQNGHVEKSKQTIFDLKDGFIAKSPDFENTLQQVGVHLDLYEIHFNEANIILNFNENEIITF